MGILELLIRIVELFDHLDHDGNGELSQEEFVNGMLMVAFSDVPVETKQMLHLLLQGRGHMHKVEKYLHHISHGVDQMRTGTRHSLRKTSLVSADSAVRM